MPETCNQVQTYVESHVGMCVRRHHAGPPRHRPGSTAVRPQRTQFRVSDAAPADGRRSAAYPDTGAPLACGNQSRFDGVRPLVTGNGRVCADSAAARLRCLEDGGGGISWRAGPAGQAAWSGPARVPPGAPIRAALLVWENRRCDPRSPCALRRRTGRRRRSGAPPRSCARASGR